MSNETDNHIMETKDVLRKWFEDTGTTVAVFARGIGVDDSTVYYWLSGLRTPSRKKAKKIESFTGIPAGKILFGESHERL